MVDIAFSYFQLEATTNRLYYKTQLPVQLLKDYIDPKKLHNYKEKLVKMQCLSFLGALKNP